MNIHPIFTTSDSLKLRRLREYKLAKYEFAKLL
jgi:hypothetical protein